MNNKRLYSTALRLIAKRDYSEEELKEKMSAFGFSEEEIERLLAELIEKKYIDESKLAEHIVERLLKKEKGLHYIFEALRRRKIRKGVLEAVKKTFDYEKEFTGAKQFFLRKIGRKKASAVFLSLKGRGFSSLTMEKITAEFYEKILKTGP